MKCWAGSPDPAGGVRAFDKLSVPSLVEGEIPPDIERGRPRPLLHPQNFGLAPLEFEI